FVTAICNDLRIPLNERPKVYKGFAQPYPPGKQRAAYDFHEGIGYIEETQRKRYIQQSIELENQLNSENWMTHHAFADGIT
ncbi:hypothetical protein RCK20_24540, partial [Salmonella enterica subsp. enterica serovar 1,4,[5],12:i:-]